MWKDYVAFHEMAGQTCETLRLVCRQGWSKYITEMIVPDRS